MNNHARGTPWFMLALTGLIVVFMLAPILLSVLAGLVNNYSVGWKSGFTWRWLGEVWQIYGGTVGWSLLLALAFMARTVGSAFRRDEIRSLEEAARTLGASFPQRFLGVLVPAVIPAIVTGSLMVFTLSVGEFNLTWMLHTPLTRTLPVGLADSYASMRLEIGSAYTLVFLMVILPVLLGLQAIGTLVEKKHGT